MDLEDILPGCKLEIAALPHRGASGVAVQGKAYKSSLYSVLDAHTFEVTAPTEKTHLVPLSTGNTYFFIFTTSEGLVRARGRILERYKSENFYLMKVRVEGELSKYQRREFYRIDVMIPVLFLSLTEDQGRMATAKEAEAAADKDPRDAHKRGLGTALDLSGGGMRFSSGMSLEDQPFVLLKFQLQFPEQKEKVSIIARARIIGSDHIPDTDRFSHRVQFISMENPVQEIIVRYIFETERLRRRKAAYDV